MGHEKESPIQFGELIQGTQLVRRFQGNREVTPLFQITEKQYKTTPISQLFEQAKLQAMGQGFRSVYFNGITYVNIGGEWYTWWFPKGK